MKILLTNDDGIASTNLREMYRFMRTAYPQHEICVCAPSEQQSGASSSVTIRERLELVYVAPEAYAGLCDDFGCVEKPTLITHLNGTPADCALLAMDLFAPDLVISGPNEGENLASAIPVSGTVGAARAAAACGVPSVAFSFENRFYEAAARMAVDFVMGNAMHAANHVIVINAPAEARFCGQIEFCPFCNAQIFSINTEQPGKAFIQADLQIPFKCGARCDCVAYSEGMMTVSYLELQQDADVDLGALEAAFRAECAATANTVMDLI